MKKSHLRMDEQVLRFFVKRFCRERLTKAQREALTLKRADAFLKRHPNQAFTAEQLYKRLIEEEFDAWMAEKRAMSKRDLKAWVANG